MRGKCVLSRKSVASVDFLNEHQEHNGQREQSAQAAEQQ
jgi:hypothetical protein